jgi:acetyltransferase-like isoleucine patch superfamily enzyme
MIDPSAVLGPQTKAWQYATVEARVVTGTNCVIGSCAWVGAETVMGDDVRIQHGAFIARRTKIGNRVFIGPNATVTDDKYPRATVAYSPCPPVLGDGCSVGAGAVILAGVTIGKGAMIGAGAVVTRDVPDGLVVVNVW